jgi:thioredoxin-dependent peroxiredoxin
MARLKPQFDRRNTKIIGLSVDPASNHAKWAKDIEETQGHAVTYPMIGDPQLTVAKLYDVPPAEARETSEGRTAVDNATVRSVFIVGPDKKIKGDDVIIPSAVSDEAAKDKFPNGWKTLKPYLRVTPQPQD